MELEWHGLSRRYEKTLHHSNTLDAITGASEMKIKEKPIIANNAERKDKLRQSMASGQLSNPYESDQHKAAKEWLRKHGIETVKALRINNGR